MPRPKVLAPLLPSTDPRSLYLLLKAYLDDLTIKGRTRHSVQTQQDSVSAFVVFCQERGLERAADVTKPVIERYQRHLFLVRKEDDAPLSIRYQYTRLCMLKSFFRWLTRKNYILANPASELELPKLPHTLPPNVFSAEEAERVLAVPDVETALGLRDRALLELLYATGLRRMEAQGLKTYDIDFTRGVLTVRMGKGKRDRVVPLGERAAAWLAAYLERARPQLVVEPDHGHVFLTRVGEAFNRNALSTIVKRHIVAAAVRPVGACHLFRHSMATLMLEGGADVRFVQQMLGHQSLETTQVYTQVAIGKLKDVHAATHPGARLRRKASEATGGGPEGSRSDDGRGEADRPAEANRVPEGLSLKP